MAKEEKGSPSRIPIVVLVVVVGLIIVGLLAITQNNHPLTRPNRRNPNSGPMHVQSGESFSPIPNSEAQSSSRSPTPSPSPMILHPPCFRIASFNIREGAQDNPTRLMEIAKYLKEQNLDVVALQELNKFTSDTLQRTAKRWGHNFTTVLFTLSGYHLGITSRTPLEIVRLRTDEFHHGMIHAKITQTSFNSIPLTDEELQSVETLHSAAGETDHADNRGDEDEDDLNGDWDPRDQDTLHVIVTHLDPHSATNRFTESVHINYQARTHARTIVVGDLNALSRYDKEQYETDGLVEKLRSNNRLQSKFLNPPTKQGEIDYSVTDNLFTEGKLNDTQAFQRSAMEYSVPTSINEDSAHAAPMRLDYVLASPAVAKFCNQSFVDVDPRTTLLSDHFPVIAQFCF